MRRAEERDGVAGAVDQAIADRCLERSGEIGPVLRHQSVRTGERRHLLAERGLEPREGEIAAGPALERPRQRKPRAVAGLGRTLDRGPAWKSQAQQLRALVESFARRVVDGGAEPAIAADTLDDEQLAMPS